MSTVSQPFVSFLSGLFFTKHNPWDLICSHTSLGHSMGHAQHLSHLKHLETLLAGHCRFTSFDSIAHILECPSLQTIDVSHNKIDLQVFQNSIGLEQGGLCRDQR